MEADMRFLAAPNAEPTFSDMFMKDVEDEMDDLKLKFVKLNNYKYIFYWILFSKIFWNLWLEWNLEQF